MLVLAIDTAGREGSLALAAVDQSSFELLDRVAISGGTYSAQVIPQLSAALDRRNLRKQDIELYVVVSGPGSFTGLRVGIATVKALAEVFSRPLVEVSGLEALAFAAQQEGRVVAALDAQRGEVFMGEFEITAKSGSIEESSAGGYPVLVLQEALSPRQEFIVWAGARHPAPLVVSPDESIIAALHGAGIDARLVARPGAEVLAAIGVQKYSAGMTVVPAELDANYIRRSDAELFSAPKLGIAPR